MHRTFEAQELTGAEKAIVELIRGSGGEYEGTLDDIAAKVGYSRAWVNLAQRTLRVRGLLDVRRRAPKPTVWRLL